MKKVVFFVAQLILFIVIPCVLIWTQYSSAELVSTNYKLSMTGVLAMLFVFLIVKGVWIKPYLSKVTTKLSGIEVSSLSVTDPESIKSLKREYRFYSTIQLLLTSIIPILLFVLALMTIKAVESGAVKLYGVLVFSGISILFGFILKIAEIYCYKMEHEE